jgi:type VI secretion system protein ImpH
MVARVVADYFGVKTRLDQFVARWYAVPREEQTRIGYVNAVLGRGALAGERVMQCDLSMRLRIGPLKRHAFTQSLPGGARAHALAKLLRALTGVRLEYEVALILDAQEVHSAALDPGREDGRLGWDACVCTQDQREPRADASYWI